jgi:hypothetical protein
MTDLAEILDMLVINWRKRQRWHKAEKSLILQGKSACRWLCDGDKAAGSELFDRAAAGKDVDAEAQAMLTPFLIALERFKTDRLALEKTLKKIARQCPAFEWAVAQPGVAELSFAAIVGEAGDIGAYKTVSGLWKHMGVAVIDGGRQRKIADRDAALIHGYSPDRRSVLWNVGNGLIGGMGHGPRPLVGEDVEANPDYSEWQKLFIARCRYLVAREPDKHARPPAKKKEKDGSVSLRESYPSSCSASAKRYVEKRFLRKLYAAWRLETLGEQEPEFVLRQAA